MFSAQSRLLTSAFFASDFTCPSTLCASALALHMLVSAVHLFVLRPPLFVSGCAGITAERFSSLIKGRKPTQSGSPTQGAVMVNALITGHPV